MNNIAGAITAVFVIILVSMTAGTAGATNTKLNEPVMGQTYTIYSQTPGPWTQVWIRAYTGDNISVKLDWINGSSAPVMWILPNDGNCNGIYLASSNDTITNGCKLVMTENTTYWIIPAVTYAMMFGFEVPVDTTLNYTFSRINATTPGHTHPEFEELNKKIAEMNGTIGNLTTKLDDANNTLNSLKVIINELKGNMTASETRIQGTIEQYNEILKNLTELQAQLDALDIPEEANLTEVYENITTLDLTCSYISENVSELSKLENITNNLTNNMTTVVYNNESVLKIINGIDANTTEALNATIDTVENLTGKFNETVAGLSGVDKKVSQIENKTASKSSIRDISSSQTPMAATIICALLLTGGNLYALQSLRRRLDERDLEKSLDRSEEKPEPDAEAEKYPDEKEEIPKVEAKKVDEEPEEEEQSDEEEQEDEFDEDLKRIMGD